MTAKNHLEHKSVPAVTDAGRQGPTTSAPALIHVVDDDDSLRRALLRLLEAAGFEARGYASAGEFLLQPPPDRPGCVLLDIRMPGPSGLALHESLQRQGVALPVIFLTAHGDIATSVRAIKAGAADFLTKPVDRDTLLAALKRALARDALQRASRREAEQLRERFASLTSREREVFDRIVAGQLNKQIAAQLGVSERTVKAERAQVLAKLGASSVAELGQLSERLRRLSDG
jgi:FixJ family two-component response regulator